LNLAQLSSNAVIGFSFVLFLKAAVIAIMMEEIVIFSYFALMRL